MNISTPDMEKSPILLYLSTLSSFLGIEIDLKFLGNNQTTLEKMINFISDISFKFAEPYPRISCNDAILMAEIASTESHEWLSNVLVGGAPLIDRRREF